MTVDQSNSVTMERCIHRMIKAGCTFCSPPRKPRVPERSAKLTPHGSGAGQVDLPKYGIAVVRTVGRSREHALIDVGQIDQEVSFVHIAGHPFLWAVEAVAARLPKLKTIQVIPSALDRFKGGARELCDARGIQIVGGHIRPEVAWEADRIGNPLYAEQRRFMRTLGGEQRALFDELLALGFDVAKMTARYFCLADEEYVPMRLLAAEYGYAKGAVSSVSTWVLGVLHYLDGTLEVGDLARRRSAALADHVARLRPLLASAEHRQRVVHDLGVPYLAATFPLARTEIFAKVLSAERSGRLAEMRRVYPRDHEALALRFGLDRLGEPTYRTLSEVGEMMGGITRERARQLEERALEWLGVEEGA